jgi:uncharacterized Zn finger protein
MNMQVTKSKCPRCSNDVEAVRIFKERVIYDTGVKCNECGFKEKVDITKEFGYNNLKLNL